MYASINDYEARHGTPDDAVRVSTLLSDAESFVREYVGTRYDDDVPGHVVALVCGMAHRALQPWADGLKSESFVDSYTASYVTNGGGAALYLTSDEVGMLRGPVIA